MTATATTTRTPANGSRSLSWWNCLTERERFLVRATGNKVVELGSTYRQDFDQFALLHHTHTNEALAYSSEHKVWVLLDCCGDLTTFPSFESAWAEFTSVFGHEQWLELKHCGQHRPPLYFSDWRP